MVPELPQRLVHPPSDPQEPVDNGLQLLLQQPLKQHNGITVAHTAQCDTGPEVPPVTIRLLVALKKEPRYADERGEK